MPGNLEESELVARITAEDETERMPPKSLGRTLTPTEIDLLKRWVEQGAEWKDHWAFIPPGDVPLPEVKHAGLAPEPDRPVRPGPARGRGALALARGEQGAADPPGRRSTSPGLPPTARRDRRLPGRHAGRTPTSGWSTGCWPRPGSASGWPSTGSTWRGTPTPSATRPTSTAPCGPGATGWSRRSTTNLPFDRFITWQLAGDLLPDPTREQVLATAFNRHHRQTNEGGSIEEEWRTEYVADRTITFGAAFLGLTLECSRCHNHKYDPITQKDFYSLFSFFNSIDESGLYSHFTDAVPTPTLLLTTDDQAQGHRRRPSGRSRPPRPGWSRWAEPRRRMFEAWLRGLDRETARPPVMTGQIGDFPLDAIKDLKVENRADPTKPGQAVEGPEVVEGRIGKALRLSGENNVTLPLGNFDRFEPFSIGLWIKTPDKKDRAVDPPPLDGLDRRRQPGLRDPDRGRQAVRRPGPLLAGQRDRDQDPGAAPDRPVGPRRR